MATKLDLTLRMIESEIADIQADVPDIGLIVSDSKRSGVSPRWLANGCVSLPLRPLMVLETGVKWL